MKNAKLSLKKVNNVDRQFALQRENITKVIEDQVMSASYFQYITGNRSGYLRDFFEFYVDDQPLISIISQHYWSCEAGTDSDFFNTHVGCLGSFGSFWDEIHIQILLQQAFTTKQSQKLLEVCKQQTIEQIRNDFLFYCCQDCGDIECGGITFNIERKGSKIIWTDQENITIQFDASEYKQALQKYLLIDTN